MDISEAIDTLHTLADNAHIFERIHGKNREFESKYNRVENALEHEHGFYRDTWEFYLDNSSHQKSKSYYSNMVDEYIFLHSQFIRIHSMLAKSIQDHIALLKNQQNIVSETFSVNRELIHVAEMQNLRLARQITQFEEILVRFR